MDHASSPDAVSKVPPEHDRVLLAVVLAAFVAIQSLLTSARYTQLELQGIYDHVLLAVVLAAFVAI
eukprot:2719615-Pyramimonas_sp.AAC.2